MKLKKLIQNSWHKLTGKSKDVAVDFVSAVVSEITPALIAMAEAGVREQATSKKTGKDKFNAVVDAILRAGLTQATHIAQVAVATAYGNWKRENA